MSRGALDATIRITRPDGFHLELSMTISAGETVALLGPNGAGKSTAVSAIAGLLPIDAGRIVLGDDVFDDPQSGHFVAAEGRRVGVVFQDYLLFPHLTVLENVVFGLRSRGLTGDKALDRGRGWLGRVGLGGLEDRRPRDLSGGQAQRVALARAMVIEPDLLLLDEPLAALDVTTRAELRRGLAEHLEAFEGPRLLITHDPTEAFLLADGIQIIEDGVVTQSGTADEIRLRPATRYAADLAGSNLIVATAKGGVVAVDGHVLHVADDVADGPVLVTIHPRAISVHTRRPDGSPRNTWETTVERVERFGNRVRLHTAEPIPLTAELTEASREELAIGQDSSIWVAVKATEIGVEPNSRSDPG